MAHPFPRDRVALPAEPALHLPWTDHDRQRTPRARIRHRPSDPPDWQQHIGNNARPQWLADAHDAIDAAVAAAYGWSETSPTTTFFASCWRSTVAVEMRVSGSSHTDGSN